MSDLERYSDDFILDNKNAIVIDLKTSNVTYFDFENMTVRQDDKKTLKPIRYITESKNMRYWGARGWMKFRPNLTKAINKLFDNYNERILLGLGKRNETSNNN